MSVTLIPLEALLNHDITKNYGEIDVKNGLQVIEHITNSATAIYSCSFGEQLMRHIQVIDDHQVDSRKSNINDIPCKIVRYSSKS